MSPMNRTRLMPQVGVCLLCRVHTMWLRNILDCVDGLIGNQIGLVDFLVRVMSCCSYYIVSNCVCSVVVGKKRIEKGMNESI